jgi:[ribosomal protein S5]-alanine N-acetyltransferase
MDITLNKWEKGDLEKLVEYANNKNISDTLSDGFPFPFTYDDGVKFIERANSSEPTLMFAIRWKGELAGSVGIFPESDYHRKNAAVAYWVAEPFWGNGIATEAIKQIVNYGFQTFDISRVWANPFGNNKASHRVLEKAGFTLEAVLSKSVFKNGEYQDEYIYSQMIWD